jgi:hypothetical protein
MNEQTLDKNRAYFTLSLPIFLRLRHFVFACVDVTEKGQEFRTVEDGFSLLKLRPVGLLYDAQRMSLMGGSVRTIISSINCLYNP